MSKLQLRPLDDFDDEPDIKSPLACLPLPDDAVLLPSNIIVLRVMRPDSVTMIDTVLEEADKTGSDNAAIIAAVPHRLPSPGNTTTVDANENTVSDLSEYACAARILRADKIEIEQDDSAEKGYTVYLLGLHTRLKIDNYTTTGVPFFQAQVTPFPRRRACDDSVDRRHIDKLRMAAKQIVDALNSILLQSKPSDSGSDDNRKGKSLPHVAPRMSAEALEILRDRIDLISETTADAMSDFLMFTLFPPQRPEAFSIKLHHLSLLDAPSRVTNAIAQLELLSASLGARQGVDERLNRIEQRKMREGVLRSLLESIYQELRVLRKQEKEDIGEPSTPINTSFGPSTPSSDEPEDEGEEDEEEVSVSAFEQRIQDSAMPVDIKKRCLRMARALPMASAPAKDIEYLEWMLRLPWDRSTYDSPNAEKIDQEFLERAKAQLENDHFGIDTVKTRLLQYLAVLRLKYEQFEHEARLASQRSEENTVMQENLLELEGGAQTSVSHPKPKQFRYKGPIICLVGPPGVGKTSIARSLATAMGRPFCRAALGGINDESAIRGFQRTYVGSMPGLFINKLAEVGVNNPVILLDEIDKISKGAATKGDPCAALLEVLDPEQNHSFTDHYINAPVDLSQVTFIATANYINDIPEPLLDRMEVIQLSGYVDSEKLQISRRYLLPKQLAANALQPDQLEISDAVIHSIIFRYSHESGVRELERLLGAVCRWKAVELTKYKDDIAKAEQGDVANVEPYDPVVRLEDLDTILGHQFRSTATLEDENTVRPGHAIGLAYTVSGNGCVLHIETAAMPGQGNLHLTGRLGEVMKDSSKIALAWIKANAYDLGLVEKGQSIMQGIDVHIHVPDGSTRVEGPSAGVALTMALLSLFSGQAINPRLAMTGEITLRGKVTAVGGIKEKCLSGVRAGVKHFILPEENRSAAMLDLPQEIRDAAEITFVSNLWQAIEVAFPGRHWNLVGPKFGDKPVGSPIRSKL